MQLVEITPEGVEGFSIENLPEMAGGVVEFTMGMYQAKKFERPWIGYLGFEGGECLGTCAFKSAPVKGRVEIAYWTFPENEGRGVATAMVRELIELAGNADLKIRLFAQTLPERNASTRVLEKMAFQKTGELDHPEDGPVWEWESVFGGLGVESVAEPVAEEVKGEEGQ